MIDTDTELRLSGQRALWGAITPGLRAVSVEICGKTIKWCCIFESEEAKEKWWEELSFAATETFADFPEITLIKEDYTVVLPPQKMEHLKHLLYLRHE